MKRPPKPTKYKHGDFCEETGRIFQGYIFVDKKWYMLCYQATNLLDAHIEVMYKSAMQRARKENLPFDIDIEYLKSIRTSICPVFGIVLSWGIWNVRTDRNNSPSLDKIKPEYGYVKGNVCIISYLANRIKQNVGYDELNKVTQWLYHKEKEVEQNVRPEQLTSLPKKSNRQCKNDTQLSIILTAGFGEDSDDANDYRGATQGENSYRSAKEGSGDSVGYRSAEVGASQALEGSQDTRHAESTVGSVSEFFERVRSQSRELDLAAGTVRKIRQFGD